MHRSELTTRPDQGSVLIFQRINTQVSPDNKTPVMTALPSGDNSNLDTSIVLCCFVLFFKFELWLPFTKEKKKNPNIIFLPDGNQWCKGVKINT